MTITVDKQGPVAIVTLDRPQTKNAITQEMRGQLYGAFEDIALDHEVRAVILTGAGGDFCSGMDVGGMGRGGVTGSMDRMHTLNRIARAIYALKKPTIAAVPGVCVGVGFSYALACDIVLAGEKAKFAAIFRNIALAPDGGLVWHLRQLIGVQKAKELVYSGRIIRAEEAVEMGIAYEKVADGALMDRAMELAASFAAGPTVAMGLAKRQFDLAWNASFEQYLDMEATMQPIASRTEDHEEGLRAFREKRKPEFRGE
ncbi:2-(1,2-epoxy-1,2-dihydrophenyl)acetyl-CoA isomerase [Sphingobium jiangsuense]|uniref:2-(1,2-epoxy-1,2-dihydrophenyl)acetyl-CoA isomerase n=1 Tax=Sphingobium jiangsuense TaxID=870476 RepID=A0A7W6FPC0_9SPHN|nr:enoyl-CoA hydratase-related protein [Sphingobium jiangsuense]MBB3925946.1 2-(1,2-epoxy-1,2-dihydrophenyl)acetyl-CoA isomerase [Sphingobium jiangsuense]GLS98630.1 2-(1,2-epoxy-1,2-dihydrophenyl)acetyl-CoA isomerase [Sphingobium jiangsuense]